MTATAKKIQTQNILAIDDPVTHYAELVSSGEIVAGPHVRDACRRHLDDLEHGPGRGLAWDLEEARFKIGFYSDVLCLNGGKFEGQPFNPELWQGFIIGSLFGWKVKATNKRRFQVAYIETGKGSGKSPLLAGIGLIGLVADKEQRAEIYSAATKKEQAQILFRDAVAMVDYSPDLDGRLQRSGSKGKEYNLAYHKTNSFFRPISADKDSQSGPRPHMALVDELHEHKDATVIEMIRAGFKFREQPLLVAITNSGSSRQTVCWDYHKYGADVCGGALEDDTFFAFICALDKEDDPFKDESCWPKANPSLGVTIDHKYLRDQVTQARGMPSKESLVKRLNFCMWTEGSTPWLSYEILRASGEAYDPDLLKGRRCVAGADLSSTTDLTSVVIAFEPTVTDPVVRLLTFAWTPSKTVKEREEKDRTPYSKWIRDGHLMTTPGPAISKLHIIQFLSGLDEKYKIEKLAFDRWRFKDLQQLAADEGIALPVIEEFGQGYASMGPAVDEFETKILRDELKHDNNPVFIMCAANAVTTESPAGDRKLDKSKANGRIDVMIAAVMAVKTLNAEKPKKSVYEERGIRTL